MCLEPKSVGIHYNRVEWWPVEVGCVLPPFGTSREKKRQVPENAEANSKGKMSSTGSENPPHSIPTTPRGVATTIPLGGNHGPVRCGRKTRRSPQIRVTARRAKNATSTPIPNILGPTSIFIDSINEGEDFVPSFRWCTGPCE